MRWPADVLAYYVLGAGFDADSATVAVALSLAATEGDDAYRWDSPNPGGRSFVGAWAFPTEKLDRAELATATRLSGAIAILSRLTGRQHDRWDWSPVHAADEWRSRLDDATAGVRAPQPGIDTTTGQIRVAMDEGAAALSSVLTGARASMLASVEHLRRQ